MKKAYWILGGLFVAVLAGLLEWQKRKIELQASAWADAGVDDV